MSITAGVTNHMGIVQRDAQGSGWVDAGVHARSWNLLSGYGGNSAIVFEPGSPTSVGASPNSLDLKRSANSSLVRIRSFWTALAGSFPVYGEI